MPLSQQMYPEVRPFYIPRPNSWSGGGGVGFPAYENLLLVQEDEWMSTEWDKKQTRLSSY